MRYYEREHLDAYARIRSEGLDQWSDLHGQAAGFDQFPNRAFLDRVLPTVAPADRVRVLEYGCGTGAAACALSARGYQVEAVDLVPDAIAVARTRAVERRLDIRFRVQDICRWQDEADVFDVVLDSFCLQSIVLDGDRGRLLDGVRRRLGPAGRYVLSTAMYEPDRVYGDDHRDSATGIVWTRAEGPAEDAALIGGKWWLPHRRHLTPAALRTELEAHGFRLLEQSRDGGDVVCAVQP